ncbi:MAG: hypothetical protein ACKOUS_19995, partial [Alphaproteobacteria bacterium]
MTILAAKPPAILGGTALLLAVLVLPGDAGAQQHLRQRGSGVSVDWTVVDQIQGRPPARQQQANAQPRRAANRATPAQAQGQPAAAPPAAPAAAAAPVLRQPPPPPDTAPVAGATPPPP